MERLTQWIDENTAIPRVNLRICGIERCTTQLARYEDTGLTPEQIRELKYRDTAEGISEMQSYGVFFYECPICNEPVHEKDNFCSKCGQRLKKEE